MKKLMNKNSKFLKLTLRNKFAYTPMSTKKSRSNEIVNRLCLERRIREEKISKYEKQLG